MSAPLHQTADERPNGGQIKGGGPTVETAHKTGIGGTATPVKGRSNTGLQNIAAVIKAARDAASLFTASPIDQVTECRREEDGWRLRIDVIEARARVGTNDLISSYSMQLDAAGEPRSFSRIARSYREDRFEAGEMP